jgi:hypothetical protein
MSRRCVSGSVNYQTFGRIAGSLPRLNHQGPGHTLLGVMILTAGEGILAGFGRRKGHNNRLTMPDILIDIDSGLGSVESEVMRNNQRPALESQFDRHIGVHNYSVGLEEEALHTQLDILDIVTSYYRGFLAHGQFSAGCRTTRRRQHDNYPGERDKIHFYLMHFDIHI